MIRSINIMAFAATVAVCQAANIHHQGVVAVNGERFTGHGLFRFALVDPDTNAYLWTNDGSVVTDPDAPTAAVTLTVVNGVYNVLLGDASLDNMTDIPESLFAANDAVVLRLWFDDNEGHGMHRLTPDLPISTVPRAAHASLCDTVVVPGSADGAVVVEPNGDVSVQSGPLSVTGGDLSVSGGGTMDGDLNVVGGATVDGDLTVGGSFTNFSVAGPFTATATNFGSTNVQLTDVDTSFCVLTEVTIGYSSAVTNADSGTCRIQASGDRWQLTARIDGGLFDNGNVVCKAHCFVFEGQ